MTEEEAKVELISEIAEKWCPLMNSRCASNCVCFRMATQHSGVGPGSSHYLEPTCSHFQVALAPRKKFD